MEQKLKELLIKELCSRLPYSLKVNRPDCGYYDYVSAIDIDAGTLTCQYNGYTDDIEKFVPYLRSMASMTEEEKEDLLEEIVGKDGVKYFQVLSDGSIDNTDATIQDLNKFNMHWIIFDKDTVTLYLDWLNAHYFDYRGLIEKGLALESPNGMYDLEER